MTQDATSAPTRRAVPMWFWAAAGLGLAWNIFGAVQFIGSLSATPESLQAQGLTPEQAAVMLGYPVWMTIAFAIGVFGGAIGCILLLARRALAVPVFALSLVAYIALYAGDILHGVFAAMGAPQVAVLTVVVAIAAALWVLARSFRARGLLV
jgi:hypothetical protein